MWSGEEVCDVGTPTEAWKYSEGGGEDDRGCGGWFFMNTSHRSDKVGG